MSELLLWAGSILNTHRKIKLTSFDQLQDGNMLLHLWELIASTETLNFIPGHELLGMAQRKSFVLLNQILPYGFNVPLGNIPDSFIAEVLEGIAYCSLYRNLDIPWDFKQTKSINDAKEEINRKIIGIIKTDLKCNIQSVNDL